MKWELVSGFLRIGIISLVVLAACGLNAYTEGQWTATMLVTPGASLAVWGLCQMEQSLWALTHKRYKVKRKRIRMSVSHANSMHAA